MSDNLGWFVPIGSDIPLLIPHGSLVSLDTIKNCHSILTKCKQFTDNINTHFPPNKYLADFLCTLSDSSNRPSSILHTVLAALCYVYCALDLNITKDVPITRLVTSLVKSHTERPMKTSMVLLVQSSCLFLSWGQFETFETEGYHPVVTGTHVMTVWYCS